MNITVGTNVWYRVFKHADLIDGLGALLPKYLKGKIVRVLSKTSFLIRSDVTNRLINRYIGDIHPCETSTRFIALDNGEEGMKKLMKEVTGGMESHRELESEQTQIEALTRNDEALEKAEHENREDFARTNPEFSMIDENQEQEPRKSRRLRGDQPEYGGW